MLPIKKTFPLTFALLLSFGASVEIARAVEDRQSIVAQATEIEEGTSFPLLDELPENSVVKINSSQNAELINNSLKEKFESDYSGATVDITTTDSDSALEAVVNKKADLASISRPLTEAEEARGFKTVPINREKIAIIVGENNPYSGNLTIDQFAKIFRGEITNWSEIGGDSQPIKVVDLTEANDTRRSFPSYPVFKSGEFKTGSNAVIAPDESTTTVVEQLGTDGISYAPVSAVKDLAGIKIVEMHKTLPDDPRYPFSQPNLYVYQGDLSPAAQGFLGFVTAEAGQGIIKNAIAIAKPLPEVEFDTETAPETTAEVPEVTTEITPETEVVPEAVVETPETTAEVPETIGETTSTIVEERSGSWWWYLPLLLLIPLIGFLVKKGKDGETATISDTEQERDLVSSSVGNSTTTANYDRINNGLATGAATTTGLGAAEIARRRRKANLNTPDLPDVGGTVDGVKGRIDDMSTNINRPNLPNVGGTVDGVKGRIGDVSSNIKRPDLPKVGGTVDGVKGRIDDMSTNINTPNMPNVGGTVDGMRNRAGDTFDNIDDRFNRENDPSNDFLDKLKEKAEDIGDRTGDFKDDLTGESDRNN